MNSAEYEFYAKRHEVKHSLQAMLYCVSRGVDPRAVQVMIHADETSGEIAYKASSSEVTTNIRHASATGPLCDLPQGEFRRIVASLEWRNDTKELSDTDKLSAYACDLSGDEHHKLCLATRRYWKGLGTDKRVKLCSLLAELNDFIELDALYDPVLAQESFEFAEKNLMNLQLNKYFEEPVGA